MDITKIDLDQFRDRAMALISDHCLGFDYPRRWNMANLGSALISAEARLARPDHFVIELSIKTGRAPSHGNDCDAQGVTPPTSSLDTQVKLLATEFGLTVGPWETCEKGWGSYTFGSTFDVPKGSSRMTADYEFKFRPGDTVAWTESGCAFRGTVIECVMDEETPVIYVRSSPGGAEAFFWGDDISKLRHVKI